MKYRLEATRKDGRFAFALHFDNLVEAEAFGKNHTYLENYFGNYIPRKEERLFTIWEAPHMITK